MATNYMQGAFSAEIAQYKELDTTIVSLAYTDKSHPEHSMEISVAPELGSNLFHFRVGEHELIYHETDLLKKREFTGDYVLWPLPNRVRAKRYTFAGKEYSLADRVCPGGDPSLVHGLVFDRSWHYQQPVVKADAASVTTYVDIDKDSPFYAGYPFASRLSLTYTLIAEGVRITYRVENKGTQTLPYGFALHPYFSLLSGREQTSITIPANVVMEADNALLPTGRVLDVSGTMYAMFDLRAGEPVSHLKLDHVYTDLIPGTPTIIDYRQQGLQLLIAGTEDFTHAVIYTPAGTSFACIEYQTCSTDAVNFNNQGEERKRLAHLLELKPGEVGSGTLSYTPRFIR
jgi:Galactose mutarotase and related enzymes